MKLTSSLQDYKQRETTEQTKKKLLPLPDVFDGIGSADFTLSPVATKNQNQDPPPKTTEIGQMNTE